MTTATTRYGLNKIVLGSDNVDVVTDFNNNWDAIDLRLGLPPVTSTTRPSSPSAGYSCFETDTGYARAYTGTAWKTVGNAVSLSGALPANPIQGDLVFLSDLGALAYYSGSAWHSCTLILCTSTTRPTGSSLQTGTFIYESDTLRLLVWNGSSWAQKAFSNYVCTSGTHPASPFTGLEIYETDTGLNGVYNGSNYLYGMQQIATTQLLGSSTASVTFSSIPAVSKLMVTWRVKGTSTAGDLQMQVDGVSTSTYQSAKIQGRAAASTVVTTATTYVPVGVVPSSTTANYFGSGFSVIQGWNNASSFLTLAGDAATFDQAGTASYWVETYNGMYLAVGPHTSLKFMPPAGSFVAGSEFSLYAVP